MDNVTRAEEALHGVLAEIGWTTGIGVSDASYRVDLGPPHVPVSDVVVGIDRRSQVLVFLANLCPEAPAANRDHVGRLINRVNWDLMTGNFEMDEDDGAVRFRSTVEFGGGELTGQTIRRAILTAMEILEAHAERISAAIAEGQRT
jgi:Putative bacterial sensory transduction regulator